MINYIQYELIHPSRNDKMLEFEIFIHYLLVEEYTIINLKRDNKLKLHLYTYKQGTCFNCIIFRKISGNNYNLTIRGDNDILQR